MKKNNITPLIVMLLVIIFASSSTAEEIPAQQKTLDKTTKQGEQESWGAQQGSNIPLLNESTEQKMDTLQQGGTSLLFDTATWIDSFFDDNRSLAEENKTRATLKLSLGYSKNDDFEIQPRVNIRLHVPKLSERAQLIFSGSDDEDFEIEENPLTKGTDHNNEESSEFTAAFRYFLLQGEKYNLNFDTGVSWDYVFASIRYRAIQDFGSWLGRFTNRLRWYSDDGWEDKIGYDLETDLGEKFFFRSSTSAGVYETKDGIPHGQIFKLFQVLSPLKAMAYEVGFYFGTDPDYIMTEAEVKVKYRQRFYRDWLVLEIAPNITFPEDNDYEANPGIIFKFEATLGYDADREGYKKVFKR